MAKVLSKLASGIVGGWCLRSCWYGLSFLECDVGEAIEAENLGGKGFIILFLRYIVFLFNVCLSHYSENSIVVQNMSVILTIYL